MFSHIRYLGNSELGDRTRPTLVRACLDVAVSPNVREFLMEMGFRLVFVSCICFLCITYTVETTYNRPGYNREPVITGIFKSLFFLPLCLCKIISPITGSQEASIGYSRDFVAD